MAYCEHAEKTKNYTKEMWAEANDGMMAMFAGFAVDAIAVCIRG